MSTEMAVMLETAKALKNSANQASESSMFMKFAKGFWTWGAEDNEVEEDSLWIIHPIGFKHGWIAWGDENHGNKGQKLGELMVHAREPLPLKDDLESVQGNWAHQISMQMMCLNGVDEDERVIFNSSSGGCRKAYKNIVNAVVAKIEAGDEDVAPVVSLGSDSYKHKEHGKIFTPEMIIVGWKTMDELNGLITQAEDNEDKTETIKPKAKSEPKKAKVESKAEDSPEPRSRRQRRTRS